MPPVLQAQHCPVGPRVSGGTPGALAGPQDPWWGPPGRAPPAPEGDTAPLRAAPCVCLHPDATSGSSRPAPAASSNRLIPSRGRARCASLYWLLLGRGGGAGARRAAGRAGAALGAHRPRPRWTWGRCGRATGGTRRWGRGAPSGEGARGPPAGLRPGAGGVPRAVPVAPGDTPPPAEPGYTRPGLTLSPGVTPRAGLKARGSPPASCWWW